MIPKSIKHLISELNRLPGIGPKSAERLVFYLLKLSNEEVKQLGEAVINLKTGIHLCQTCFQFSEMDICSICADPSRDHETICVVETVLDLLAIERVSEYKGIYHVLQGRIDPLKKIGPEHIRLQELKKRLVGKTSTTEIIIATDPDMEGETTALYIAQILHSSPCKITRLARGLPEGGNVEFADDNTLRNALKGRTIYE